MAILHYTKPVNGYSHFDIPVLSKKFLSEFWIFTWQPTGNDDYWHLTCSVLEHWSRSGGQTCSHVLAWHSASAKTIALYCLGADWPQKAWHSLFPELSKIQKKLRPRVCSKTHMRLTQIIRDFESPSNWISNWNKKLEQTKSCCSKILHLLRSLNVHTATGLTCEKTMKAAEGSREGHQAITQQRNHQATCYFTAK